MSDGMKVHKRVGDVFRCSQVLSYSEEEMRATLEVRRTEAQRKMTSTYGYDLSPSTYAGIAREWGCTAKPRTR